MFNIHIRIIITGPGHVAEEERAQRSFGLVPWWPEPFPTLPGPVLVVRIDNIVIRVLDGL